jgi:hypothetical protein
MDHAHGTLEKSMGKIVKIKILTSFDPALLFGGPLTPVPDL